MSQDSNNFCNAICEYLRLGPVSLSALFVKAFGVEVHWSEPLMFTNDLTDIFRIPSSRLFSVGTMCNNPSLWPVNKVQYFVPRTNIFFILIFHISHYFYLFVSATKYPGIIHWELVRGLKKADFSFCNTVLTLNVWTDMLKQTV